MREAERDAERSRSGSWEKVWRRGRGGGRGARGPPRRARWPCALTRTARVGAGARGPPGQVRTQHTAGSGETHPAAARRAARTCVEKCTTHSKPAPTFLRTLDSTLGCAHYSIVGAGDHVWGKFLRMEGGALGSRDSDRCLDDPGANVHTITQQTLGMGTCCARNLAKWGDWVEMGRSIEKKEAGVNKR